MQTSRMTSRAFKAAASGSKQSRSLHMTGPATYSKFLTSERPAMNPPHSLAGLRYECQKLKLPSTGSKEELKDRITAHELTNGKREFSTSVNHSKRPLVGATVTGTSFRHFNTSRELKKPNDSSTIDFAYIPDFDPDLGSGPVDIRVPVLPTTTSPNPSYTFASAIAAAEAEEEASMRLPVIHAVSSHTHFHAPAAMSEVHDNSSVDFQGLAFQARQVASKTVEEGASTARQLWNGLVDDVLGPKGNNVRPA